MDKNYFAFKGSGKHETAVAVHVASALQEFCNQEPEFEQAIEQSGKTFADCLDSICKGIGSSISDLDLFTRAVKFYFPVAAVRFHMTIDLCGDNGAVDPPITMTKQDKPEQHVSQRETAMQLSLDSLLDF